MLMPVSKNWAKLKHNRYFHFVPNFMKVDASQQLQLRECPFLPARTCTYMYVILPVPYMHMYMYIAQTKTCVSIRHHGYSPCSPVASSLSPAAQLGSSLLGLHASLQPGTCTRKNTIQLSPKNGSTVPLATCTCTYTCILYMYIYMYNFKLQVHTQILITTCLHLGIV